MTCAGDTGNWTGEIDLEIQFHNSLPSRWRLCDPVQDLGVDGEQQHPEGGVDLHPAHIPAQVFSHQNADKGSHRLKKTFFL